MQLFLWFVSRWRPSKCFSMKSFRELFGFGSKLMLSGLLSTLWSNIYLIVIGKAFPKADLGYYTRAQQFADFPASALDRSLSESDLSRIVSFTE